MKRERFAIAAAALVIAAAAVSGIDGPRAAAPAGTAAVSAAPAPTGAPSVAPLWRIDVPTVGGPFNARLSPDARLVAIETATARTGLVISEILPPVPPSKVAHVRELLRLDRVAGPIQWLPDSSGLLAYEPDLPSGVTGFLSLVTVLGKRWSVATTGEVSPVHSARFSPDGRYVALANRPPGALVIALDSGSSFWLRGDENEHFAGWDNENNLLFHVKARNMLEARTADARVVYAARIPEELQDLGATLPTFAQPRDVQVLSFDRGGCCQSSHHTAGLFFDRKVHVLPTGLEDFLLAMGDGPWRGGELTMRREADDELVALGPRTGAIRMLGAKVPHGQLIWGISGDFFAFGRHLVDLSTGVDREWTVQPPPESIIPLGSGRFVMWRDGTTELLDAAAWFAAPQLWTGELPMASDQSGLAPDWVRVRDDDGGFVLARPRSWSSYEASARGAVLASGGPLPSVMPGPGDVRVEIRLDIVGPRGPRDFLDGLAHHGGRISERGSVLLPAGAAEFAIVFDNTMYPKPVNTLNWALRSPYLADRVVWIRAWPLDSGRRAEVEAMVATLEFVPPR